MSADTVRRLVDGGKLAAERDGTGRAAGSSPGRSSPPMPVIGRPCQ
ncbi:hypothetical protein ACPCVO_08935 [Streptomyces umbrinus]